MLTLSQKEFNLGKIKLGTSTSFKIELNNTGNQTYIFDSIGTSCSCTSGYLEKNPLPPHTKTNAIITFNSNKVGKGDFVKSATIKYKTKSVLNGNANPKLSEHIKFKVIVE